MVEKEKGMWQFEKGINYFIHISTSRLTVLSELTNQINY